MIRSLFAVLLVVGLSCASLAQVLYSTSFEAPTFTVGTELNTGAGGFDTFGDVNMPVSGVRAHTGSQSVLLDIGNVAWPDDTAHWNWVALDPYDPAASTNKVLVTTMWFYLSSNTGNSLVGLDAYNSAANEIGLAAVDTTSGNTYLFANATQLDGTPVAALNQWNKLTYILDFNTNTARALLNGVDFGVSFSLANTFDVSDVDIYGGRSKDSTSQGIFLDDYSIAATIPVSGTVTLSSWIASRAGVSVTVKIVDPGTQAVIDTQTGTLNASGNFTIYTTAAPGTYTVKIKASHWLTRAVSNVVVPSSGAVSVNASLINGDVNGNDSVGLSDFTALRVAFNSNVGDGNYNPGADLNGSGNVSLSDFTILRANFGLSGD